MLDIFIENVLYAGEQLPRRSTRMPRFIKAADPSAHRCDWQEFGLRAFQSILADEPEIFLDLVAVFAEVRDAAAE